MANIYKVYMAVTSDKFELPIAIADSLEMLAKTTGVAKGSIASSISRKRSGKKTGMKFVCVQIMYNQHEW